MPVFNISGLASGINTEDIVKKLLEIEKKPLLNLQNEQKKINEKLPLLQGINLKLLELKSIISDLTYETPFATKKISSSNQAYVSAQVIGPNVANGNYIIDSVSKIATATIATSQGTIGTNVDINEKIATSIKKSITAGSFSINNYTFFINPQNQSISDVINMINAQTNVTGVVASYDHVNDKLILSNATVGNLNTIIVGSSNDTSNFLSEVGLTSAFVDTSSGTTKIISNGHLGAIDTTKKLSELNFEKPFIAGKIKINGVEININANDTLNDVLNRITLSNANVIATYDVANDKIKLTSKSTGKSYIKIEEVANGSNFLELTGLIGIKSSSLVSQTPGAITLTSTLGDSNFKTQLSGSGVLQINHGNQTTSISYNSSTTIQELIDTINSSGIGVTASFDSQSGKFYIKPDANSNPNITLTELGSGNIINVLNFNSSQLNQIIGEDAEYKINGVTYYSNSNTINDKFKDISFTLNAVSSVPITLTVTNDASSAKANIEKFVKLYNEIITEIDKQIKDEKSPLYRESSLRDILDGLRRMVNKNVINGTNYRSLGDIGISTGAFGMIFTDDYIGKLEIDTQKLESALASNPSDVRKLFAYDPNGGNNYIDGFAYHFSRYLESLTKVDGTLNKVVEITNKELRRITQSIADWNVKIKNTEASLYEKFNAMEVMLGQIKRQGEALMQQLSKLGG